MPQGAPIVQYFSPDDYGDLPTLWAIAQDHRGVMYIGAENNVLEFDGQRWRAIATPKDSLARSMATDKDGTVYVGSVAEFGYLAPGPTGETVYRSLSDQLNDDNYRQFDNVWSTHATSHGVYFVGDNVIYRWHDNKLSAIDSPLRNWGFSVEDQVIVYHRDGGLSRIANGQIIALPGTETFSSNTTNRIYVAPYEPGEIIIFTTNAGTFRYRLDATADDTQRLRPFATGVDAKLQSEKLYYQGAHDRQGRYYLPTLSGSVLVVDKDGNQVRSLGPEQGLKQGGIATALFIDNNENLWATSVNGLFHIQLNTPWSRHDSSAANESIIIETYLHQGELYVSSYHGVYYLSAHGSGDDRNPSFHAVDAPKRQTFAMSSVGDFLIAGLENQVYAIRGTQATKLLELDQSPMIMSVGRTARLPRHLFLGTYSSGIRIVELATDNILADAREIPLSDSTMSKQSIRFIEQDTDGDLWIATETNGLYQITFLSGDPTDYRIKHYDETDGLPSVVGLGLISNSGKLAVYEDRDVYRIEKDGDKVRFVAEGIVPPDQVATNGIIAARFFGEGYFIERQQQMAIYHRQPDGSLREQTEGFTAMPNDKSNGEGTYVVDGQYVWFSMGDVLYQFDPRAPLPEVRSFPALIRSVAITGDTVFSGRHRSPRSDISHITLSQQPTDHVPTVPYARNALTFEYAASFYEYLNDITFSYQLEGFDSDWSPWSPDTKKEYTNLPENSYRFRLKARNAHGHESSEAVYSFTILAPWYRTYWAYAVYLSAATLILIVSVRTYSWRLLQARKRLEALVKVRTAELESSLAELRRTQTLLAEASHDAGMARVAKHVLHNVGNALNSIKVASSRLAERFTKPLIVEKYDALAKLLKEHRHDAMFFSAQGKGDQIPDYLEALTRKLANAHDEVKEETTLLEKNLAEIEEILNEQKELTRAGNFQERVDLEQLIQLVVQQSDIDQNIQVGIDMQPVPAVMLDRYGFQSILFELLDNAKNALATRDDKEIQIRLKKKGKVIFITVEDNGEGIDADKLNLIFSKGYSTKEGAQGKGLHDIANSATELHGRLSCVSDGPGHGAVFTLELPFIPADEGALQNDINITPLAAQTASCTETEVS